VRNWGHSWAGDACTALAWRLYCQRGTVAGQAPELVGTGHCPYDFPSGLGDTFHSDMRGEQFMPNHNHLQATCTRKTRVSAATAAADVARIEEIVINVRKVSTGQF